MSLLPTKEAALEKLKELVVEGWRVREQHTETYSNLTEPHFFSHQQSFYNVVLVWRNNPLPSA